MKSDIWMPLFIGDYMADTIGMSKSEHGSYLLSMMKYWRKGGSLTAQELREVCEKDIDRVSRFYNFCEGRWHHKRIDQELEKARKRIESAREKAQKSVEARRYSGLLPERVVNRNAA